jgi:hypothetical protein
MIAGSFMLNNEDTIREATTFVRHTTSAGNIKYAADIGHDDSIMTVVNASSVFDKYEYREMVESYAPKLVDTNTLNYFKEILKSADYIEATDYSSIINVNRQRRFMSQYKQNNAGLKWF